MKSSNWSKISILALTLYLGTMSTTFWVWHKNRQERVVIMGPPWLLYSDEKLLDRFEYDALCGKENVIRWNQILYERFFYGRCSFTKAKPFLDAAAELGDETAQTILKDPEKAYRMQMKNCGVSVPDDFHLE